MENRTKIANKIRSLVKEYEDHPWFINCGSCEEFAQDLSNFLGEGAEILCVEDLDEEIEPHDSINHFIVLFDGFFYDAEEPFGVSDWKHLPLCARVLRERKINKNSL